MKHKRLNRDGWGFQYFPYYQMRIDEEFFHGMACLIRLTDGEANYWHTPKAGRVQVTGKGMTWLELIPDNTKRVITVKYYPDGTHDPARRAYPAAFQKKYRPSIWYVDIMEGTEYDDSGILVYIDKYLDVIFTPEGEISVSDRDELDQAFKEGELSEAQYREAILEGELIQKELCEDLNKTNEWCSQIREVVEQRIAEGETVTKCRGVKALEYFDRHFHCSQAVLAAFSDKTGLTEEQSLKLGGCFGSGMRKGEVCGACTGALMVLGLLYGQYDENDLASRERANLVNEQMMEQFAAKAGSYICNELLGEDIKTPEGLARVREQNLFHTLCPKMVATAVMILEQIIADQEKDIFIRGGISK